ncbi:MAG: MauE/DoxX family redox-associated membrane protein [Sedimentisphaerales bacterium]
MKRQIVEVFVILVRIAIGSIFIASSIPKLRQPYDFLASVYSYKLVGFQFGLAVAVVLPWVELFVGICLVGGILVTGALLASIGLFTMFGFVLASALWRGLNISCGCFNSSDTNIISYWTLGRAIGLLLISLATWLFAVIVTRISSENLNVQK